MSSLRYTLLADGSSDRVLMHVVDWAVRRLAVRIEQAVWADLSYVRPRPRGLDERVRRAIALFPCDVLFVHRDAEKESLDARLHEIHDAVVGADGRFVPIVPVRMTEAWLLHDENAIRRASGNPRGKVALDLPEPDKVETVADPKQILFDTLLVLFDTLLAATEFTGRRRKRRRRKLAQMRGRVAELIDDFAPLLGVPAFDRFLNDLHNAVLRIGALERVQ